ncbi:MAG: tetratricopeptide repeat protein [Armatimonadetes bacterium]|nr:tetratricopeptide repeat protein [Armatimonadota bacterium]
MSLAPAYTARETLDAAIRFHVQGLSEEAEHLYREFLKASPDHPKAVQFLGVLVFQSDRREEGLRLLERAVRLAPNDAEAWSNLGNAYRSVDRIDEAVEALQQAIKLDPVFAPAYCTLCTCLRRPGTLGTSIDSARMAAQLQPSMPQAHSNLGYSLLEGGDSEGAVSAFRQALYVAPRFAEALQGLVFAMHYSSRATAGSIKDAAEGFRSLYPVVKPVRPARAVRTVAFVSPDFRAHPVAYFLEPVLRNWDKERHRLVLVSTSKVRDGWTERMADLADDYVSAPDLDAEGLRSVFEAAGADVAVDLAGHTAGSSAAAFAARLAPLQVSYLGYSGTTGIPSMDAVLADAETVRPGEEGCYTETIALVPGSLFCFDPDRIPSPVTPSPALKNGFVTFGSFNNMSKVSDPNLAAWADILAQVPDSRFVVKSVHLGEARFADRIVQRFRSAGIGKDRVEVRGWSSGPDPFADYGEIDVALDTFPYTGATTTVEALHMGVPVVTLRGDRYASRMSSSILSAVGKDEWITGSVEAYVAEAARLAGDTAELARIRSGLRAQVAGSSLCQGHVAAKGLQDALDALWESDATTR